MGVDLGIRKIATSYIEFGLLQATESYESHEVNRCTQLSDISQLAYDNAYHFNPDYVIIEEPLIGNNRKYSMQISQAYGAVLAQLGDLIAEGFDLQVIPVNVGNWKKGLLKNGHATKAEIREYITALDPAYPALCGDTDQDRYDAAAIGLYGHRLYEVTELSRSYHDAYLERL